MTSDFSFTIISINLNWPLTLLQHNFHCFYHLLFSNHQTDILQFNCFQKSRKSFQSPLILTSVFSLIKAVNFAILASCIIFNIHSSKSFHCCIYRSLATVIIYKNKVLWVFSNFLSINPQRKKSGFTCLLIFKILGINVCIWILFFF